MLSYLHGYHAGNHADVLKHTVLSAALARLIAKDKPLRYIDTHAGAGGYELRAAAAQRNREYEGGVGKLWTAADPPPAVARWLTLAARYNGAGALKRYPGSPWFAQQSLRPSDDLFLFERHPAEFRALKAACDGDRRTKVLREDGLTACIGLVPPPSKRALAARRSVVRAARRAPQRHRHGRQAAQALRHGRARDLVSRDRAALGRALRTRIARYRSSPRFRPTSCASRASAAAAWSAAAYSSSIRHGSSTTSSKLPCHGSQSGSPSTTARARASRRSSPRLQGAGLTPSSLRAAWYHSRSCASCNANGRRPWRSCCIPCPG